MTNDDDADTITNEDNSQDEEETTYDDYEETDADDTAGTASTDVTADLRRGISERVRVSSTSSSLALSSSKTQDSLIRGDNNCSLFAKIVKCINYDQERTDCNNLEC